MNNTFDQDCPVVEHGSPDFMVRKGKEANKFNQTQLDMFQQMKATGSFNMKRLKCESISPIHEENIDNYVIQSYLGQGSFGVVYKCRSILDN